jgi:DNA polymerase-3 subunit beta
MKIRFEPKDFSPKFRLAASVAASRDIKPILQNVKARADKMSGIVLQATDSEVGIRIRADCDIVEEGEALLPKELFSKILDLTKEERLTLTHHKGKIVIDGEVKEHYKLDTQPPDEFPYVDEFGETAYHKLPVKVLQELIRRTVYATDNENYKYALGGVSFEMDGQNISTVATDGRRLAWQESVGACINDHKVEVAIAPTRTLQLLNRALGEKSIGEEMDVKMAITKDMVWFQCRDITLFSRLIEGRFPKWRNIIPKTDKDMPTIIKSGELLTAVLQAQVTSTDHDPGISLTFEKGRLTLQGEGKEKGQSKTEIPIVSGAIEKKVKVDPKFLTDFLRVLDADKNVSFYLPPDNDPIKITADDGGYVYVVMPLSS